MASQSDSGLIEALETLVRNQRVKIAKSLSDGKAPSEEAVQTYFHMLDAYRRREYPLKQEEAAAKTIQLNQGYSKQKEVA
jgi:hypothetical protein